MNNSKRLVSSTFYEPDEDDYYAFAYPNSSRSSSNLDLSSGSSYLDTSSGSSCPLTYSRLKPHVDGYSVRSPRNVSIRSVSPTCPRVYQQVIPTYVNGYQQGTPRPNTTMNPVQYQYNYDVDDDEPIKTTLYNQSTEITQGRRGTRVKRNTTETQEYFIRNSDLDY